jgi:hypothetical protein
MAGGGGSNAREFRPMKSEMPPVLFFRTGMNAED